MPQNAHQKQASQDWTFLQGVKANAIIFLWPVNYTKMESISDVS
jgi:hypothetical protein